MNLLRVFSSFLIHFLFQQLTLVGHELILIETYGPPAIVRVSLKPGEEIIGDAGDFDQLQLQQKNQFAVLRGV